MTASATTEPADATTQATSPEDAERRAIEPADLCRLRAVGDVAIHPDGHTVVYAITWPDADSDSNRSLLYSIGIDGTGNRQLSHGQRDTVPKFSPDGTRLAFLRAEPDRPTSVMILAWPVGELTEVARFVDGATTLCWAGDDRLIVTAPRRPAGHEGVEDEELARRPRIVTALDYRYNGRGYIHDRPRQISAVSGLSGDATIEQIGRPGVDHGAVAVSPDGRLVAAVAGTDDDRDLTGFNHIWLYAIDGSGEPARLTGVGGNWTHLVWHRDGPLVATGTTEAARTGFHRPHLIGLPDQGRTPSVEPLGHHDYNVVPDRMSGNAVVAVDGAVLYPGVRRGRIAIDRYGLDGTHGVVYEQDDQVLAFDASADGSTVVAAVTTPDRPAELWRLDGVPDRLVGLNDELLARLDLGRTERVAVTSADGTEVEAFVVRPPATAPGGDGLRPGLVYVHGGPMFQYGLGFFDEFQMAAACGYVVIGGNPRGSDGYGEAWATAIVGDLGNRDWADVSAIADHLAALPEVDPDRVGIGGGSYGGFMTAWALSHDQRFGAGLVERAVTSWHTMYGTSDIGTWFSAKTIGATIEADPAEVTRQSPLHYAAAVTTPTLIVHAEQDWRCPIEQAEQLFAAIRRSGGDAILVRFPGENHELTRSGSPSHRVERFEIVHEFFAHHLGGADFGSTHLPPANGERP